MKPFKYKCVTPLQGMMQAGKYGFGEPQLTFSEVTGQYVQLILRREGEDFPSQLQQTFGLDTPAVGRWCSNKQGVRISWTGHNQYFLQSTDQSMSLYADCLQHLAASTAVIDQGHSRAVIRVWGDKAVDVLQRHCDLDLPMMQAGESYSCQLAHMMTQLLRLDDVDEQPCFELQVMRSMAESLWQALDHTALQFAYEVA